jgi:hypothetical protein
MASVSFWNDLLERMTERGMTKSRSG